MTHDATGTAESDDEAFNNCAEADRWLIDAAVAKVVIRQTGTAGRKPLTAARLIALSARERAIYRGALAYANGTAPGQVSMAMRADGAVWLPRSGTWGPPPLDHPLAPGDEAP